MLSTLEKPVESTAAEQVVACALVTQRARVRSLVGISFMGEVFSGFSSPVRQMLKSFRPPSQISFGHPYHPYSFITGANDLRCWRALKPQIYKYRNAYRVLVGIPESKRPSGRPRRRREDNIKMDSREVGCDPRDWIALAEDRDQWRACVRAVMNLRVPWKPIS